MNTLASIARNENFLNLTVTPTAVEGPAEYFPAGRRYYRWDVQMSLEGRAFPDLDAYTALIDHISLSYGKPILSSVPLVLDASFTASEGTFTESLFVEDREDTPCPSFVEDGSCIHSEHTR